MPPLELVAEHEYALLWFALFGLATAMGLFARWSKQQVDKHLLDIQAQHDATKTELKRTIQTVKQYHDECQRERRSLNRKYESVLARLAAMPPE